MKTTTHIRRFANTKITKNVTKNTKKSAPTKMLRSLTTKRSRFPRKFVILKSTPVILEAVLTQTFIPETLDSVLQAITRDTTRDTTPDTTPDTTLETLDSVLQAITRDTTPDTTLDTTPDTTPDTTLAVAILADRFL